MIYVYLAPRQANRKVVEKTRQKSHNYHPVTSQYFVNPAEKRHRHVLTDLGFFSNVLPVSGGYRGGPVLRRTLDFQI